MLRDRVIDIRKDFPYLAINDGTIIYFDNAATSQKPKVVIDDLAKYYAEFNGNPHRGAHYLAMKATEVYEEARAYIANYLNASTPDEIIFVRNATEGLNLAAYSYGFEEVKEGDEILISIMEHHSNLVNWQEVAKKNKAILKYLYLDDDKQIAWDEFTSKITEKTKILAITAASNVVGTMPDIKKMIEYVRANHPDVVVVIDGSQFAPHNKIDVKDMDCDFFAFSGHKMLSPMGIGVLYGKKKLLDHIKPFMYGGDMIEYVYEDRTTFLQAPGRFEAGTQNVGGAFALKSAINYLEKIGLEAIAEYERALTKYCYDQMIEIPYIDVYTTSHEERSPLVTFNFKEVHPHDVASILDTKGIAIRSGHHCAQPLHRKLGLNFSCRASFAFYNTFEEVDYFIQQLDSVRKVMGIGS